MDPRNGQILLPPLARPTRRRSSARRFPALAICSTASARRVTASPTTATRGRKLVFGPRFGVAYDLSGDQKLILRGGVGLFYDRPDGNTVFSIPGNPPIATPQDLRNGSCRTLGGGLAPSPVPGMTIFQYDAKVPASWQWQGGVQMSLPWASSLDVSYVGNHGFNRLGASRAAHGQPERG